MPSCNAKAEMKTKLSEWSSKFPVIKKNLGRNEGGQGEHNSPGTESLKGRQSK